MKKVVIIFLLCQSFPLLWRGAGGEVCAQQQQLDSLKKLLIESNSQDIKELQILNVIALVQVNINPNDALANADKAIVLAEKLNNKKELAVAYNNKGFVLLRKCMYEEANKHLRKALALNIYLNNQNGIADNQILIAEILRRLGETDSSKTMVEKALRFYEQTNNPKGRADAYYYLALVNRDLSDFKTMFELCNKAIIIYSLLNDESQLALAIDAKCGYYYFISEYDSALHYSDIALELGKKNSNKYGLAMSYASFGHIYSELPDFPKALDNHLKALKIHEEMDNLQMQGNMNVNIGLDYYELKNYNLALQYTEKGIRQLDALKINNGQYRMAVVYMGMIYIELKVPEKSIQFTERAIKLCIAANDDWALSDAYNCLGDNYLFLHRYYDAITNFKRAFELSKKMEALVSTDEYCIGLGKAIMNASDDDLIKAGILPSNRNREALAYFEQALKFGKEMNNKLAQRNANEQLSFYYERQRDHEKSFEYYKSFITVKDSIDNADNANAISLLQIQYETEKKEKQIALLTKESKLQQTELQKQKTTRNMLIAACTLIAMLAGIIYNRYRIKQNANAAIEKTLHHLKTTQEQLIEREKLATLGKFTADVAREIEVPVKHINHLTGLNRTLILNIKSNNSIVDADALKNNLKQIFTYGKEADAVVKKVLTETRKFQA